MNNYSSVMISLIAVFVCTSCQNDLYKAFYKESGVSMYFIYPLAYESTDEKALVDFTVEEKRDAVRVVFSLFSSKPQKIEDLAFEVDDSASSVDKLQRILVNKKKNTFEIRYEAYLATETFQSICRQNHRMILNGKAFDPTKKTTKSLQAFLNDVVVTFDDF